MAIYKKIQVTREFLDYKPNAYFVFGDNLQRFGNKGAAQLRDHPHALGFITKKFPSNDDGSFYKPEEYAPVFFEELKKLVKIVKNKPDKIFYVSQIGSGLANKFRIWELLIKHNLESSLGRFNNVIFCWEENLVSKLSY